MAVIDFFDRGWRANPQAVAYVMGERAWTYDEAGALSCRIAHALLDAGVGRGSAGAVLSPNDPLGWICVLGLWRAGASWVPLHPRHPVEENAALLARLDCSVVFFHASLAGDAARLRAALPRIGLWIALDDDGSWRGAADGAEPLASFVDAQPGDRPHIPVAMDDVVALTPTGGTTGEPKAVMNTHRSVGTAFAHLLMALHYPADMPPVNLAAAPMTHSAGALTMPCSARGGTVVVLASPDPVSLLDTIERHRVTELFLPPTVIYRLIEMDGIRERDFSSLRYLIYGSAPMAVEKLKAAIDVFGPVLIESYGQTEAPMAIAYLRPEEHLEAGGPLACDERLASCGRPAPLIRVEIRDDGGGVLGPGETGEICVAGDLVMKGYHDDPSRTADAIRDGWLHTGDVGHLDAHGYLHITDRKKDMIITGGFNVYPAEVEQALFTHPAVADCAVIGIPDSDWGELVTAIVECAPGTDVDEPELIALCKARLDSVRAPKHVEFVTALPRNANGKVVKRDLRDRFATSLPGAQP